MRKIRRTALNLKTRWETLKLLKFILHTLEFVIVYEKALIQLTFQFHAGFWLKNNLCEFRTQEDPNQPHNIWILLNCKITIITVLCILCFDLVHLLPSRLHFQIFDFIWKRAFLILLCSNYSFSLSPCIILDYNTNFFTSKIAQQFLTSIKKNS